MQVSRCCLYIISYVIEEAMRPRAKIEHIHEEANRQFDPTESRDINLGMGRSSIRQQTSSMGPSPGMSG